MSDPTVFSELVHAYLLAKGHQGLRELCEQFEVSISTVQRWHFAEPTPHTRLMPTITEWINAQLKTGLDRMLELVP